MQYWNGNLIASSENEPSASAANGIFDVNSQLIYRSETKWPLNENVNGVVTDGLVWHFDAGNSASYSGSGTTWSDLSGNSNNATLTNGPVYSSSDGGYFTFDGSNDYADMSGSASLTSGTYVCWLYRDGDQGLFDGIVLGRHGGSNINGIQFYFATNKLGYTWNAQANTYGWDSGLLVPNQAWCMVAVSIAASSAVAYLYQSSGVTTATNSVTHSSTTHGSLDIGRDSYDSRYMKGRISMVAIYNRALSSSEVAQNYNALKSRYGL